MLPARLYLWRVQLPNQPPVLTSIKAACLASTLAAPELALQLDSAGQIISAQISVPSSVAAGAKGSSCSISQGLQALQVCSLWVMLLLDC